jgi:peptidoglycan hydrolase-like protein with peptidoglycan-binding domain
VGSTGSKVTELQRDLTELGYGELLGPPGIDGKFGPYTEGAVKQFQIDNGLKGKDGVAGPETWGAICDLLSSM